MLNDGDTESKSPGLPPGSLVYTGPEQESEVRLFQLVYNTREIHADGETDIENLGPKDNYHSLISVCGIHRPELIRAIGERFGLHSLVLEDILNRRHRTKLEVFPEYIFLILKWPSISEGNKLHLENIALVIGENWVIYFQERGSLFFEEVRSRIRMSQGRIRKMGTDYLGYALMDTLVDYYFPLLEQVEDQVEQLDHDIVQRVWSVKVLDELSDLKRTALKLWKVLWSMRDLGNQIQRVETKLISKKTYVYFRDMQDHVTHLVELSDMMRIRLDDLTHLYLGRISMHMNEIMKTMTIVGSIFIPLTFIAGVYGMNFQHMPELSSRFGYPAVWLVMVSVALGLLTFFRWRKWL